MDSAVFQIRMCLGDIGKGWFDINERNAETYEVSKLKRFMELIKFKMQVRLIFRISLMIHVHTSRGASHTILVHICARLI